MSYQVGDLVKHLHEEQLSHKSFRNRMIIQKLVFISALPTLGSLNLGSESAQAGEMRFPFVMIFYFLPFIASAYDMFIFAENYKVKRVGSFLKGATDQRFLRAWEVWASTHREITALYLGNFLLTLSCVVPGFLLYHPNSTFSLQFARTVVSTARSGDGFSIWFMFAVLVPYLIFAYSIVRTRDLLSRSAFRMLASLALLIPLFAIAMFSLL